jgi:ATP-dependent Clp protease protease subunit
MSVKLKNKILLIDIDDDIMDAYFWGISYRDIKDGIEPFEGKFDKVKVRINSNGGSVTEGMAIRGIIVDLKEQGFDVDIEIAGVAASMASVIAVSGTTLSMRIGSYLMIHRPYTFAVGDFEDLRNTADTLEKMHDDLVSIYVDNSDIERVEVSEMMDSETWITSSEAVEKGFANEQIKIEVDEVLNMAISAKSKKSIVMSHFKNIPEAILNNEDSNSVREEPKPGGEGMATLKSILAKDPEAQKDFESAVAKAVAAANENGAEGSLVTNPTVVPELVDVSAEAKEQALAVLKSTSYPDTIKDIATAVFSGKEPQSALVAAVSMHDSYNERFNSLEAKIKDLPETTTSQGGQGGEGEGVLSSAADVTAYLDDSKGDE